MNWQVAFELRAGILEVQVDLQGDRRPVVLIGPNGAGKTTVLRTLCGAHYPRTGRFQLGEEVLFDVKQGVFLPPERRGVGYVPQGNRLFPHLSVLDNVAFGLRVETGANSRAARRNAAESLLGVLDCTALAGRSITGLSGGERQKVALARALASRPRMLLLDEPLAALDVVTRRELRNWMADYLASQSLPALIVTHDPRDVLALDAWVVVLENGRVVQQGESSTLVSSPASRFVEAFFEGLEAPT